jgi:lysozyme
MNKPKPTKKKLAAVVGAAAATILLGTANETGFTERFEGWMLTGYFDPIGVPTKCAGDTYDVEIGKRYTEAECRESLEQGLIKHAEPVLKCAPYLKDKPFALAMAVDHNYHFGQFCGTSIDREFKAGNYRTACVRFNEKPSGSPQWVFVKDGKGGFKTLPGLVKRAAARREVCLKGAA